MATMRTLIKKHPFFSLASRSATAASALRSSHLIHLRPLILLDEPTLTRDEITNGYTSKLAEVVGRESNQLGVRFISTQVSPQLQPRDPRTVSPSDPRYEVHPSSFRSELFATMSPKTVPTRNVRTTKVWCYNHLSSSHLYKPHAGNQTIPRWFSVQAQGGDEKHHADTIRAKNNMGSLDVEGKSPKVISFSPLEGRISGLRNESLKIKRIELSQKLTYALIPALLIISKTKLTTSMLILAVYWQIYGFFKEIFLDYVHQEVTRKWILVYFKLLLLILLKDTVLAFDLV